MKKNIVFFVVLLMSMTVSSLRSVAEVRTYTMEDIFELADANSQRISVSRIGLVGAQEGVKSAKSKLLPDVNMNLSGSYIGTATVMSRGFSTNGTTTVPYANGIGFVQNGAQPTPHWGNNFSFQASQVIYAGGALKAGIRMAEVGEQMAELDVERNRQEVRFILAGNFLDLCKLNNQREVLLQNISLTRQLIATMQARREQGTVLRNDITRYELQLQQLLLSQQQVEDATEVLNFQLITALHLPDTIKILPSNESTLSSQTSPASDASSPLEDWQQKATDRNIDLQQATLAIRRAEQQVKMEHSDYLPQVALVVEDHLGGPYVNDLIPVNANVNSWFVGIGIKYNLGSLWRKNHALKKAHTEVREQQSKLALVKENVECGVQAHYVNLLTSFTEVETQEKQVELSNQNYDVVKNRYENELALLTDMLDASNLKLSADMALVNARIGLLYNFYKLKYVTSSL